jgi:hypothetical protein
MSRIPLKYHTNIKFYTQYTHPMLSLIMSQDYFGTISGTISSTTNSTKIVPETSEKNGVIGVGFRYYTWYYLWYYFFDVIMSCYQPKTGTGFHFSSGCLPLLPPLPPIVPPLLPIASCRLFWRLFFSVPPLFSSDVQQHIFDLT